MYTDENKAYSNLENHGYWEYIRGYVYINGMESFWDLVRREYNETFHHIDSKHMHRYINEFSERLNIPDTVNKMCIVIPLKI